MGNIARQLRLHGNLPPKFAVSMEGALASTLFVDFADSPDLVGTVGAVDLTVKRKIDGAPVDFAVVLEVALFRDADRTVVASGVGAPNGTIGTATVGSFLAGEGTAAAAVKTDTAGRFVCSMTLTSGVPETLFAGAAELHASPELDTSDFDSVTFSA